MKQVFAFWGPVLLRRGVAVALWSLAGVASAAPGVSADAAAASSSSATAFSVSASDGAYSATSSRTAGHVAGTSANAFVNLTTSSIAGASSDFTVVGLVGTVPLTFNWEFSGHRAWNVDSASFQAGLTATLIAPGFIDNVGWGVSFVDGPVNQGDFAGILSNTFSQSTAGLNFANVLPPGSWDGEGSRRASTTMSLATTGSSGSFGLQSSIGLSGDITASFSLSLVSVNVANAGQMALGAHLLLDNGSQVAITTAVPEPQHWAMLAAGLLVMTLLLARRRA